jgi:uncharacterized protein
MKGKPMKAVELLEKYFTNKGALEIILHHSRLVAAKALRIADSLGRGDIDRQFIEEAALLHDIGVCRTTSPRLCCHGPEPYISHGIIGREILEAEGLPRHALVCERHIGVGLTIADVIAQNLPIPKKDMVPLTIEEKIVSFADLFYSKKQGTVHIEKSPDQVRANLMRFGAHKVVIFDGWMQEFRCPGE